MGLELAEMRLLDALRREATGFTLDVRVVGGRGARHHARRIGAEWIPARSGTLPRVALRGADLIHLIGLDLPPPSRKPFVAMVHDLSSIHYEDEGMLPPWVDEIVNRARVLLTPSRFTATELVSQLGVPPERICVVGGGPALDASNARRLSVDELHQLGIETPFVLRYGGYTRRKNVALLLDAWEQVPTGTLVLAGPPHAAREEILARSRSRDRLVILDYAPEALLARLLCTAAALVSTSAYEGFGLPPLEGLAAGSPVVATSSAFVREIVGDAALLVDENPEALAEGIRRVLTDNDLASRLRVAGPPRAAEFTWERTAAAVCDAYGRAMELEALERPGEADQKP
jgi:glycosyltransferase involved in cell wall biosynthesis